MTSNMGNTSNRRKNVLNGEWETLDKIGSGTFASVYRAVNINNPKTFAAVKTEDVRPGRTPSLQAEYEFYRRADNRYPGLPCIYYYGDSPCGARKVLVMSLLGNSLDELASRSFPRLSIKTVLMIGIQGLKRLKAIHGLGFVHRDIKPDNILIGRRDPHRIYVTDFGLCERFKTPLKCHIQYINDNCVVGSRQYASINALKGITVSRTDDLESFGYCLVEFFRGFLPWARAGRDTLRRKENTPISELCETCPSALADYFNYIRALPFGERPDYRYLTHLLQGELLRRNLKDDRVFDWVPESRRSFCSKGHNQR